MALLSEDDRVAVWRALMRRWSNERSTTGDFGKVDLRQAVNDMDDHLDSPAMAALRAQLPNQFRLNSTIEQQDLVILYTMSKRFGDPIREE